MKYNGTIYRPPIEANTFLLPITEGCTHNNCSFCNMYQGIPFRMLSIPEVEDYLTETKQSYGRYCERIQRVYLVGADPLSLPFFICRGISVSGIPAFRPECI